MKGDITGRDHANMPYVDCYVAGPPCQPWSAMGKQKGMKDYRSNATIECLQYVKHKQPKLWIMENVANVYLRVSVLVIPGSSIIEPRDDKELPITVDVGVKHLLCLLFFGNACANLTLSKSCTL